jgi:ketosteroid isomerase-like protein
MTALDKEREVILETDRQWARAAADARDIEHIISFWSDDAKIFAPGLTAIIGKEAIRQFVQNSLATPGFTITWVTTEVVVSSDATFAYATGTNQTTVDDPEGRKITIYGNAVTVWRKEASGHWKCVIDIWNEDPRKHD